MLVYAGSVLYGGWVKKAWRSAAFNLVKLYFAISRQLKNHWPWISGGARVFAARGKRLCCAPLPYPVAYLEIWKGAFRVYIFRSFQILAYFFTVNISTFFSHPNVPRRIGVPRSIRPWSLQSDRQSIFLWLQGDNGVDCEQYAKLRCI